MNEKMIGELKSSNVIHRYVNNPVLSAKDIPYKADWVFNSSVIKHKGQYVMVFRNDYYTDEGKLGRIFGMAKSDDGIHFDVEPEPIFSLKTDEIRSIYDPRLVAIDGRIYMSFTTSTLHGQRAMTVVTDDFKKFEVVDHSLPDSRNTILFPQKINNKYYRLERPFWAGIDAYNQGTGNWIGQHFHMWLASSPDLKYWGEYELLLPVEKVPYANIKVGGGPSPIKTSKGWLVIFHAVDFDPSRGKNGVEERWTHRYTAGVMLLDLDDPQKVLGISKEPLLVPEAEYEVSGGFRNNVVFPTAAILEDDGEVKIYYGSADAVTCLATANIDDLVNLCL